MHAMMSSLLYPWLDGAFVPNAASGDGISFKCNVQKISLIGSRLLSAPAYVTPTPRSLLVVEFATYRICFSVVAQKVRCVVFFVWRLSQYSIAIRSRYAVNNLYDVLQSVVSW